MDFNDEIGGFKNKRLKKFDFMEKPATLRFRQTMALPIPKGWKEINPKMRYSEPVELWLERNEDDFHEEKNPDLAQYLKDNKRSIENLLKNLMLHNDKPGDATIGDLIGDDGTINTETFLQDCLDLYTFSTTWHFRISNLDVNNNIDEYDSIVPYCYLVERFLLHLSNSGLCKQGTFYRSIKRDNAILNKLISIYQSEEPIFSWGVVFSAAEVMQKIDKNDLIIIFHFTGDIKGPVDIATFNPAFDAFKEVLFPANSYFIIDSIEDNTLITVTQVNPIIEIDEKVNKEKIDGETKQVDPKVLFRLGKELNLIQNNTFDDYSVVFAPNGKSPYHFKGYIPGPKDTCYENGIFLVDIILGENYPLEPPKIKFLTKIHHPNISNEYGAICVDFLKTKWSATYTIDACLVSIQSLLSEIEFLEKNDAKLAQNQDAFFKNAKEFTKKYAENEGLRILINNLIEMGYPKNIAIMGLLYADWEIEASIDAITQKKIFSVS